MSMQIMLNGKQINIQANSSLLDLIDTQGFELERIVVEHNASIVAKEQDWAKIMLTPNDKLEVLSFVGGG